LGLCYRDCVADEDEDKGKKSLTYGIGDKDRGLVGGRE